MMTSPAMALYISHNDCKLSCLSIDTKDREALVIKMMANSVSLINIVFRANGATHTVQALDVCHCQLRQYTT